MSSSRGSSQGTLRGFTPSTIGSEGDDSDGDRGPDGFHHRRGVPRRILGFATPRSRVPSAISRGGFGLDAVMQLNKFREVAQGPPPRTSHEDDPVMKSLTPRQLQLLFGDATGRTPMSKEYARKHPRGVSSWGQHDYPSWVERPVWGEKYARPVVDRLVEHKKWHAAAAEREHDQALALGKLERLSSHLIFLEQPMYRSPGGGGGGSVTMVDDAPPPSKGQPLKAALQSLLYTVSVLVAKGERGATFDLNQRLRGKGFAGDLVASEYPFEELLSKRQTGLGFENILIREGRIVPWNMFTNALTLYELREEGYLLQLLPPRPASMDSEVDTPLKTARFSAQIQDSDAGHGSRGSFGRGGSRHSDEGSLLLQEMKRAAAAGGGKKTSAGGSSPPPRILARVGEGGERDALPLSRSPGKSSGSSARGMSGGFVAEGSRIGSGRVAVYKPQIVEEMAVPRLVQDFPEAGLYTKHCEHAGISPATLKLSLEDPYWKTPMLSHLLTPADLAAIYERHLRPMGNSPSAFQQFLKMVNETTEERRAIVDAFDAALAECKQASVSRQALHGGCDDRATLLAEKLQETWGKGGHRIEGTASTAAMSCLAKASTLTEAATLFYDRVFFPETPAPSAGKGVNWEHGLPSSEGTMQPLRVGRRGSIGAWTPPDDLPGETKPGRESLIADHFEEEITIRRTLVQTTLGRDVIDPAAYLPGVCMMASVLAADSVNIVREQKRMLRERCTAAVIDYDKSWSRLIDLMRTLQLNKALIAWRTLKDSLAEFAQVFCVPSSPDGGPSQGELAMDLATSYRVLAENAEGGSLKPVIDIIYDVHRNDWDDMDKAACPPEAVILAMLSSHCSGLCSTLSILASSLIAPPLEGWWGDAAVASISQADDADVADLEQRSISERVHAAGGGGDLGAALGGIVGEHNRVVRALGRGLDGLAKGQIKDGLEWISGAEARVKGGNLKDIHVVADRVAGAMCLAEAIQNSGEKLRRMTGGAALQDAAEVQGLLNQTWMDRVRDSVQGELCDLLLTSVAFRRRLVASSSSSAKQMFAHLLAPASSLPSLLLVEWRPPHREHIIMCSPPLDLAPLASLDLTLLPKSHLSWLPHAPSTSFQPLHLSLLPPPPFSPESRTDQDWWGRGVIERLREPLSQSTRFGLRLLGQSVPGKALAVKMLSNEESHPGSNRSYNWDVESANTSFTIVNLGDERQECSAIANAKCTLACVYAVFWEAVSLTDGQGAIAQVIESVSLQLKQLHDRVPDAMAVLVAYNPRGVSTADLARQTRDVSAAVVDLVMEQRSSGPHGLRMLRQQNNRGDEDDTRGWEQEQEQEQDVSVIVLHEDSADDTDLRESLLHMAERLPFAKYPVPASYHRLRDLVVQIRSQRPMLSWDELEVLASSCGLSESARNWLSTVATQSGIAQSFSDASLAPRAVEDRKVIDGRQDEEGQGAEHKATVTLQAVLRRCGGRAMYSERFEAAVRRGVNTGIAVAASWLVSVGDAIAIGNAPALGQVLSAQAWVDRAEEELEDAELAEAGFMRDLGAWKDVCIVGESSSDLESSTQGLIEQQNKNFLRSELALRRKDAKKDLKDARKRLKEAEMRLDDVGGACIFIDPDWCASQLQEGHGFFDMSLAKSEGAVILAEALGMSPILRSTH